MTLFSALQLELPMLFGHTEPRARRVIQFGVRVVQYELRRTRRRTIGLTIDQRGLTIAAPNRTPMAEIEQVMRERQAWIVSKLDEWTAGRRANAARYDEAFASLGLQGQISTPFTPNGVPAANPTSA